MGYIILEIYFGCIYFRECLNFLNYSEGKLQLKKSQSHLGQHKLSFTIAVYSPLSLDCILPKMLI